MKRNEPAAAGFTAAAAFGLAGSAPRLLAACMARGLREGGVV
ncbi:MAG: hypothetical protein ACYC9O_10890 [Candidatus Latescibacterota bacterium]